jgi:hypothetical protein
MLNEKIAKEKESLSEKKGKKKRDKSFLKKRDSK